MKRQDEAEAGDAGHRAHPDRVAAEIGTDGALFDDRERHRQRAGAQQGRELGRLFDGEAAADLAGAAGDRFRMTGALSTLPSSTMANGWPTLSRVISPKRLAPIASNRKVTTGSLVCWSKPGGGMRPAGRPAAGLAAR